MKYLLITLLASSLFFVSCSKEKSNKWLVIDLSIKSALTGEPIDTYLSLEYRQGTALPLGEDQLETVDLGGTENGKFTTEMRVSKRAHNFVLKVAMGGVYIPGGTFVQAEHQLSVTKNNVLNLEWTPANYWATLELVNASCYDETDSLWISYSTNGTGFSEESIYTGCIDGEMYEHGWGSQMWPTTDELFFRLRTKKNGITETMDITKVLEPEILNKLRIEY